MQVGNIVKVLYPFSESFPEKYSIENVQVTEDSQTVYFVNGVAFDEKYLEIVE